MIKRAKYLIIALAVAVLSIVAYLTVITLTWLIVGSFIIYVIYNVLLDNAKEGDKD